MPLTPNLSPDQTFQAVLEEVRNYMRDYPELNRLLEAEETSDRQIRWYVIEVLDDFSVTPPPLGVLGIDRVPRSILLKGAIAEALTSAAILNLRNELRYTDGGFNVDLDKHQAMLALAQMFRQEYEMKKVRWKVAENIARSLGSASGVHSEYALYQSGYYGYY